MKSYAKIRMKFSGVDYHLYGGSYVLAVCDNLFYWGFFVCFQNSLKVSSNIDNGTNTKPRKVHRTVFLSFFILLPRDSKSFPQDRKSFPQGSKSFLQS